MNIWVEAEEGEQGYGMVVRRVTPEEFHQIATAEGYVKLDVDVEALREGLDMWNKFGPHRTPLSDLLPIVHAVRQVLAALDGETT